MTGRERIQAALNGEWVDRRPVLLHNFLVAAREAGLTMKQYRENPGLAARALISACEKYQLDGILVDFDTATLAGAAGVPIDFPVDEPARVAGPLLLNLEAVEQLEPVNLDGDERVQIWLETCRIITRSVGDEIFVRGNCDQAPFSLASMIRGPVEWMMDLLNEKTETLSLLEYCCSISRRFIQLVAETGVHMLSNGDSPAGPEMVSPDMYQRFALPFEKRLVDTAHVLQLPYALHICGDTAPILSLMLQTGSDALELDHKTALERIRENLGDKTTLFGTIDPVNVMQMGSPDKISEKISELLRYFRGNPRLIINAGCALPPDTPAANIRRLVETVKGEGREIES